VKEKPKQELARKAINFDLNTNEMRKIFKRYTEGYRLIRKSFKKLGFEHEQGSGYISKREITEKQVQKAIKALVKENPWLAKCAAKFKVTDPATMYDAEKFVTGIPVALVEKQKPAAKTQARREKDAMEADKKAAQERMTETLRKKYIAKGMAPEQAGTLAAQRAADWHNGNVPPPPKP
jgi:virulence-associated protein VapD